MTTTQTTFDSASPDDATLDRATFDGAKAEAFGGRMMSILTERGRDIGVGFPLADQAEHFRLPGGNPPPGQLVRDGRRRRPPAR